MIDTALSSLDILGKRTKSVFLHKNESLIEQSDEDVVAFKSAEVVKSPPMNKREMKKQ